MKFSLASMLLAMMASNAYASQATCRVNPDPHFLTFDGIYYDYHGGCDLVLIQNPTFDGSDVFYLHIRTVPLNGWGGITNAALQIGSDVLEVEDSGTYSINGAVGPLGPGVVANMGTFNYPVTYAPGGGGGGTSDVWEVQLNALQYVRITNFNWGSTAGSISIEVLADSSQFSNSVGMCGTWGTPGLIGRDGVTDYQGTPNAGNDMGLDWEVLPPPTEPQLFQVTSTANCTPGTVGHGGADGHGGVGEGGMDVAVDACKDVDEEQFNNCVFDVLTTGNVVWADAPHYFKYKCISDDFKCMKTGGKCVHRKDCDDTTHLCNPKLCYTDVDEAPVWLQNLDDANAGTTRRRLSSKKELPEGNEGGKNNVRHRDAPLQSNDEQVVNKRNMVEHDNRNENANQNVNQNAIVDRKALSGLSELRDPCVCAIPRKYKSGKCCKYTGPIPYNCAAIELLGPGADYDGRCNQANGGHSCEWDYTDPDCCEIAMNDGNCNLPCGDAEEQCKCALEKEAA